MRTTATPISRLACLVALLSLLVATLPVPATAQNGNAGNRGGNSAVADACRGDGWQSLYDSEGNPFKNVGDCVSYGARQGQVYRDSDGDGVLDDVDQCPGFDDRIDVDQDGIPDGCDDQDNADSDDDGVENWSDACPGFDDRIDVDQDGIPDGCDDLIDSDNDGVADDADNCPFEQNADQLDSDSNGVGDVCDDTPDLSEAACIAEAERYGIDPSSYTILLGTAGDDSFEQPPSGTLVCGFGGDDWIPVVEVDVIFIGGEGNDSVYRLYGVFFGGDGDDSVDFVDGTFYGGDGNDYAIWVSRYSNGSVLFLGTFYGEEGDDSVGTLQGFFDGGPGIDSVMSLGLNPAFSNVETLPLP